MNEYILTYLQDILDGFQSSARKRNNKHPHRIIHGYDSVTPEFLWSLIIKHIPILKADIKRILQNVG